MIKQVKLGSVPYKIVRGTPVLSDEGDKVLWGEILQGKQVIKVDSGLAEEMQRVVLLHEILHGLLNHCGLSDHKEELPERLGYALDAFLVDNPEFVDLYVQARSDWFAQMRKWAANRTAWEAVDERSEQINEAIRRMVGIKPDDY